MDMLADFDILSGLFAILSGILAYLLLDAALAFVRSRKQKTVLHEFGRKRELEEKARIGAWRYQVRSAFQSFTMDVAGRETFAVFGSSVLIGLVLSLGLALIVPLLLAIPVGLGAGYLLVQNFVRTRWNKIQLEIEKEIPTFMRNLAGILQTDVNPGAAIEKASQALMPEKPLKAWLDYFLEELQTHGQPGLGRLQAEANDISTSLGLLVFEIGRMAQTGGSGYADAFQDAADNLSQILEVRAEAHTEAKSALGLAKLIIVVAVVIDGFLVLNPDGGYLFASRGIRIAMAGSVVWGIMGWVVIRKVVEEAIQ